MLPIDAYYSDEQVTIYHGDAWELAPTLAPQSINTICTSPPYWGLRDYGEPGQFGLEPTPEAYVARLVALFALLRPALRDDGTVWLNLGDSYARSAGDEESKLATSHTLSTGQRRVTESGGMPHKKNRPPSGFKPKDLIGIPWRVAFALQADGWYLRQDIIWHKPNPMPESVTDRCTKAHEYVFLLSKSPRYYCDMEAIKEPSTTPIDTKAAQSFKAEGGKARENYGTNDDKWEPSGTRNKRSVWSVNTAPFSAAHFATFPPALITPCILAGCPEGGKVLDPFGGSGTTAQVARQYGRKSVLFELNADYIDIATSERLSQGVLM